jgi:hypothetical protein
MTCKHCGEPIAKNTVRRSNPLWTYHPWKHEPTHLLGCFGVDGNKLGTIAEPKEDHA